MRHFLRTDQDRFYGSLEDVQLERLDLGVGFEGLESIVANAEWGQWRAPLASQERIIPDGRCMLVFTLSDPVRVELIGPSCAPFDIMLTAELEHVGVELAPGAVPALFGCDTRALCGTILSQGELEGVCDETLYARLVELPRAQRARWLLVELRRRFREALSRCQVRGEATRLTCAALRAIRQGEPHIGRIAAQCGVSPRRLEQCFARDLGLSPKRMVRLTRFHRLVEERRVAPLTPWAELAAQLGFTDQAHMINEVRAFSGRTPGELERFGFFQDVPSRGLSE